MSSENDTLVASPGADERTVRLPSGEQRRVPSGWQLLPPGDAGLTRRVKAAGPTWTVQEKRGRKIFSRGVWAPAQHIETARAALSAERSDPKYKRKLEAGRQRRADEQAKYEVSFRDAVLSFLAFDTRHGAIANELADAVAAVATPVGSGTVGRTKRIPIEQRAEAAVIAWMRHQTTAYDDMSVPRVKGARRELRRALAERSRRLLEGYRHGFAISEHCPLARALGQGARPEPRRAEPR